MTVAGSGNCCHSGDGGAAVSATPHYPEGLAVDASGNIYLADTDNGAVRSLTPAGAAPAWSISSTDTSNFTQGAERRHVHDRQ
jgi:hypothetical protein